MTYEVSQGPEWAGRLLVDPPLWMVAGLAAITVICVSVAIVSYRRHGIDHQVLREQAETALVVVCIVATTQAIVGTESLPYVADVLAGTALGYAMARLWIYIYDESDSSAFETAS